ncbi:MAG: NUDIX hydrolase [Rhodospirillaceae bacterium]|jgi:ADP-ribose pyrophosphatase|nr:NUDIX hydrolase [Rhodospirillaceae bacterium]
MRDKKKLENWATLDSRTVLSAQPYLDVRIERVALPDGRVVEDFYQVDVPDFVVIFAEAEDGRVLVIRQYKHGAKQVSLTFPGGDLNEAEAPLEAARRELKEETGHAARSWLSLGNYAVNGNQGCGWAHYFIAKDCHKVCEPESGDLEEMEIIALGGDEIFAAAKDGEFKLLPQLALFSLVTHPELLAAVAVEVG